MHVTHIIPTLHTHSVIHTPMRTRPPPHMPPHAFPPLYLIHRSVMQHTQTLVNSPVPIHSGRYFGHGSQHTWACVCCRVGWGAVGRGG